MCSGVQRRLAGDAHGEAGKRGRARGESLHQTRQGALGRGEGRRGREAWERAPGLESSQTGPGRELGATAEQAAAAGSAPAWPVPICHAGTGRGLGGRPGLL